MTEPSDPLGRSLLVKGPLAQAEAQANAEWLEITRAVVRFRKSMPAGHKLMISPSLDPHFRIERMRRSGELFHLEGVDSDGNSVTVVHHRTQLSLRMVSVAPENAPERGTFGFLSEPELER